MEHDSTHALQYFFNPVDYLHRLVEKEQPEVMDPKSAEYGLIDKELVQKARFKLFYEMDGFYISGFFQTRARTGTLAAADMIEDLRSKRDVIRGLPGAGKWAAQIRPCFDKGGLLEWLQEGTNRRDVVNVYLREDGSDPGRNLWFLDDERVFPDSMRGLYVHPIRSPRMRSGNWRRSIMDLEKSDNLSKDQIDKIAQDAQAVARRLENDRGGRRADGGA